MTLDIDIERRLGDFSLTARFRAEGGLTAIFGHSGAGKSTLINLIAGLIDPHRGRIVVGGRVLFDSARGINIPVARRRIGYVFQDGLLLPHLTVRQNLGYGRWFTPRHERFAKIDAVVDLLGIAPILDRRPASLSGGERQRVAIGRALLASPHLLLMDEPLASLDGPRKEEILPYIQRLRDERRVPIVYVSHALAEVARLATTLVLMSGGQAVATGPAADILGRVDLFPLTGRVEAGTLVETTVAYHESDYALTVLDTPAGPIRVPQIDAAPGTGARIRIHARDVTLALRRPEGVSALNVLPGIVAEIGLGDGSMVDLRLDCAGTTVIARLTRKSVAELRLTPGTAVYALFKTVAFERQTVIPADAPSDGV